MKSSSEEEPAIMKHAMADLMTPSEVAVAFRVDAKTVTRWARQGKIRCIRTPGGHRRYRRPDVEALLHGEEAPPVSREDEEQ